jgi:hypothetical protein
MVIATNAHSLGRNEDRSSDILARILMSQSSENIAPVAAADHRRLQTC